MKIRIYCLLFFVLSLKVSAQDTGVIKGVVIDEQTGELLPGASVILDNSLRGSATDMDGAFTIDKISSGVHSIMVSFISYVPKTITDIEVSEGKVTTVKIFLKTSESSLSEVVVVATVKKETINAMQIMQKNAIAVSDGISAESIKKTPDRSSSDVLKRISGASIQENKFAVIRGLNDRYNAAYINGAPLPSSESDRKAFAFDIFPSSMLDNMTITKSATPDMPADFAGGVISINTRAIPEANSQSVALSAGYNTLSTFKEYTTYKGGKLDWIGMDDGTRSLPNDIPETEELRAMKPSEKGEVAKKMNNDWALIQKEKAAPNRSFQYAGGFIGKVLKNEAGAFVAINHSLNNNFSTTVRNEFEEQTDGEPMQVFELTDRKYSNQVSSAALVNIGYKLKDNNQFSFKNIYNVNAEDMVVLRDGIRDFAQDVQILERSSVRWFTANKLYSGQLAGEHYLPVTKARIKWNTSYSKMERNIPNLRRMLYSRPSHVAGSENEPEPQWEAAIPVSGTSPSAGGNIFYSNNNETIKSMSADLTQPLDFMPVKTEIKVGGFYQLRERDFKSRQFGYSRYSGGSKVPFDKDLLLLPEDSIFMQENMGEISPYSKEPGQAAVKGRGGFKLEEATKLNDSYTASADLTSYYAMMDNSVFKNKLRLIWGVRMEKHHQVLTSFEDDGDTIRVDTTNTDFLPSVNTIYKINDNSNFRFSYYKTLSRPEFRELAPFGFFDFVTFYTVRGNPDLKRALIDNYDLRYEWFPGGGQMFTSSIFYKRFTNAIEQVNRADVPRELYYDNVPLVQNYGVELEYRVNARTFYTDSIFILDGISVFSNIAFIQSMVDVSKIKGSIEESRPLQGQSPFILNAGLTYVSNNKAFSTSLSVNRVGRRIAIVGNTQEPHLFENPRTTLDLQIAKTVFKRWELKLNIRDILAQDLVFYQDLNDSKKYDKGDNTMATTNFGQTITLGLAYKFDRSE